MIDKQQLVQMVAQIIVNNMGNRITQELATGMVQEISRQIPDQPVSNDKTISESK